jgi:Zinc carboxypeptidase
MLTYSCSVTRRRSALPAWLLLAGLLLATALLGIDRVTAVAASLATPEQFIGFKVGADNKLVRWDKIVEYMQQVAAASDRVRMRELGKTNGGNPFILVEISSADTIKNLDRQKQLARELYFQDGTPSVRERDEIFRRGKIVVLLTCNIHADEIGPSQMTLELVHQLATSDSPAIKKILDNVIFLLVPSLNPDGQIMVTDWFNRNLGTPYQASPLPTLYHPYAGHDNNRDMYMFTQKESEYLARLAWHDWFPVVWLDAHQMGMNGPRIFVMPATDPINPNVHPVIYRWNTIFGQSQAAALEAAGKTGIIHNATYTNFWQGAMAWSGWWHNQIGLLTEIASVRIAAPIIQLRAPTDRFNPSPSDNSASPPRFDSAPIMPPTDTFARTEYPRPWLGGRWTLRDIVDYQLITTMAMLETASDRRDSLLRQVFEVNRSTVEDFRVGDVRGILIPVDGQHDLREVGHLVDRLAVGGVDVYRAENVFEADEKTYPAGTYVLPMSQVFARYAKDLLEPQVYPEVRRGNETQPEPPYDVTAWSLGMKLGVNVLFVRTALPDTLKLTRVQGRPVIPGKVSGTGPRFTFDYFGADTSIAINRLLKAGGRVAFEPPLVGTTGTADLPRTRVAVTGIGRDTVEPIARELSLTVTADNGRPASDEISTSIDIRTPRVGMYYPWTGGNVDEGWTRWVLEQYEFPVESLHNADIREGRLRQRFDVIILPDQSPREMLDGFDSLTVRPEYRGGLGTVGVGNLDRFVAEGGTLIAMGAACDMLIDQLNLPVRDLRRNLRRDQHFSPGSILRVQVDTTHPVGFGMAADTYGFYDNSPFFALEGLSADRTTVVARYPTRNVLASGWLKGEELMIGRSAVVSVDMRPGHVVLFGLRPQHRAQTHATFPMLFNALYLSTSGKGFTKTSQ